MEKVGIKLPGLISTLDKLKAAQPLREFFVDFTGGNDLNDGLSPDSAWKTITKVNASTFSPGDSVLFKRGETWTGIMLTVSSSGTVSTPITFGAYGSGANPIIDGNDAVNCLSSNDQDYLLFRDIEVTQGVDLGFYITSGSAYVSLLNCIGHDCGVEAVSLDGCGHVTIIGGDFYDGYQRVVATTCAGITLQNGAHDITIDGAICRDGGANVHGISIHNHLGTTFSYNVTITDCTVQDNNGHGIYMQKQDNTVDTDRNILFQDCIISGSGSYGLYMFLAGAAYIDGVTFRQCVFSYPNGNRVIYCRADNLLFERCEIITDAARGIYASGCQDFTMYNCTFYATAAMTSDYLVVVDNARTSNFIFKNNIARAASPNVNMISVVAGTGTGGMDIDYNLWGHTGGLTRWWWLGGAFNWANWKTNSGQDANSPVPADPLFTNPAADDFTLQAMSPAIDAGVDVGLSYCGTAPDCGAYERC
jgi:parallel beta-helix repeat protein